MNEESKKQHIVIEGNKAAFWRRCCAMLYDILLILACVMFWTFFLVFCNKGEAITAKTPFFHYVHVFGIFAIWWLFIAYFTYAHGQTLGMRAWRLIVVDEKQLSLSFFQAGQRAFWLIVTSVLGMLWALFDKDHRALYERLSHTQMLQLSRNPYTQPK